MWYPKGCPLPYIPGADGRELLCLYTWEWEDLCDMPYLREEAHLYVFHSLYHTQMSSICPFAWARTAHMIFVQLSRMEVAIVGLIPPLVY